MAILRSSTKAHSPKEVHSLITLGNPPSQPYEEPFPQQSAPSETIITEVPSLKYSTHYMPKKRIISSTTQSPRYLNPSFVPHASSAIKPKYFFQRSPRTGDLVSKPNSNFMPSNIQIYPTLVAKALHKGRQWGSSKKALCLCRMHFK